MRMTKHDIPILEFDPDPGAVIPPDHAHIDMKLPSKAVYAFLADHIDDFANAHRADVVSEFVSATKRYPVYVVEHKGEPVCLVQAPVGAPAAVQILDWLIAYGVEKVISSGSCGALEPFEENVFLVPSRALRDEGTSYHYAPPSRFIDLDRRALQAIEATLGEHGLPYREVTTWSTDGFYRETKEKVAYRKEEGCAVVEMECAALAACASMRGAIWGELLFTADTLANAEQYDPRGWGGDSFAYALQLCLDAVVKL